MKDKDIIAILDDLNQSDLMKSLGGLSGDKRAKLMDQLASLNYDRFKELRNLIENPPAKESLGNVEPAPVKRLNSDDSMEADQAVKAGAAAFADDRVAALTVAGGQGTRLGFDGPKGAFPITPVKNKTLFQYLAEKIQAARQRYDCRMPWWIMTSPTNDKATREFFITNDFFGLPQNTVNFFSQNVNPILNSKGGMTLNEDGSLLVGPDGHGGVFEAMKDGGVLDDLSENGFDLISYFQVDNPMVTVADERFIGYHLQEKAEFSCKVIAKREPFEGLGVAVIENGQPGIIEYIDLPEEMATEKNHSGELKYLFGSIAVHVINTDFALQMADSVHSMPWHIAEKKYPVTQPDGNTEEAKCYKFEKFVFDCLSQASACAFVEAERTREFGPVKNASGKDSPEECRKMLQDEWKIILQQLGVSIQKNDAGEIEVELSPLLPDPPPVF